MPRILYQIQAYIGRLVLLLTIEFGQIIYLIAKTDNLFIIFLFLKIMKIVKMTKIFKCFMFGKYSSCVGKARGCCKLVFNYSLYMSEILEREALTLFCDNFKILRGHNSCDTGSVCTWVF